MEFREYIDCGLEYIQLNLCIVFVVVLQLTSVL